MKAIDTEKLIKERGFFAENEYGLTVCVVSANDIRNAPEVDMVPAVPGHSDQYNISEMSYKNGYAKGREDIKKEIESLKAELQFTRQFIHSHGLEFALASAWEKAGQSGSAVKEKRGHWIIRSSGHGANATNLAECSECHVCGSPHWKVCPVCETRMEKHSAINIKEVAEIDFDYAAED